jgi:hypothetical protein
MLVNADLAALFSDAAACIADNPSGRGEAGDPMEALRRRVAARLACHSSVRGGEITDSVRLSAILKDLEA